MSYFQARCDSLEFHKTTDVESLEAGRKSGDGTRSAGGIGGVVGCNRIPGLRQ